MRLELALPLSRGVADRVYKAFDFRDPHGRWQRTSCSTALVGAPGGGTVRGCSRTSGGTRQWAYKGYALYTYADDEAPGQNRGQATYTFAKLDGGPDDLERAAWLAELGETYGGAGVYWNVAKP